METSPELTALLSKNLVTFMNVLTLTFMRPLGLLFGFIGIAWAVGGSATLIRTAIAFSIAIPLIAHQYTGLIEHLSQTHYLNFFLLLIKELLIGFAFGTLVSIPFWIVQISGSIVDSYRGESNSGATDPTGGEISTLARYQVVVALLFFAAAGGFSYMIGEFYKSYILWPITDSLPQLQSNFPVIILDLFTYIIVQAFLISAPLLLILLIIDFITLMCGKIIKGFNSQDISSSLKNLTTILLLPVLAIVYVNILQSNYFNNFNFLDQLQGIMK
ncbi:MAG: EscT/YscT/HrcT family type III secretion system export apparatus protein [Methyloligellaceae bacterium]